MRSVPTATPTTVTSAIFSATSSPSRTRPRANLASTFSSFSDAIAPAATTMQRSAMVSASA